MSNPSSHERDFWRIARIASTLSIGIMAAFIASIRSVTPQFVLDFSALTVVAFLLGAVAAWVFWSLLPQDDEGGTPKISRSRQRMLLAISLFVGISTIGGFVLNMKGIEKSRLTEIIEGTFFALVALTIVGFGFLQAVRFLEQDRREHTHEGDRPAGDQSSRKDGPG